MFAAYTGNQMASYLLVILETVGEPIWVLNSLGKMTGCYLERGSSQTSRNTWLLKRIKLSINNQDFGVPGKKDYKDYQEFFRNAVEREHRRRNAKDKLTVKRVLNEEQLSVFRQNGRFVVDGQELRPAMEPIAIPPTQSQEESA